MQALDELGDYTAPAGSKPWAIWYAQDAESSFRDARRTVGNVQSSLRALKRAEVHRVLHDAKGRPFPSWEAFCNTRRPFGLGIPFDMTEALLSETDVNRLVLDVREEVARKSRDRGRAAAGADDVGKVLPKGQPRKEMPNLGITCQHERAEAAGVSRAQQQKLDALARRAPDLLEHVKEGRMSAHAAALEAGIVKPACPVKAAKKAVEKMDEDQFDAFMMWLETR